VTYVTALWTIKTEVERCIGSGNCAFLAPEIFDVDTSGRVVVLNEVAVVDEKIRMAIENCPTNAIALDEEKQ